MRSVAKVLGKIMAAGAVAGLLAGCGTMVKSGASGAEMKRDHAYCRLVAVAAAPAPAPPPPSSYTIRTNAFGQATATPNASVFDAGRHAGDTLSNIGYQLMLQNNCLEALGYASK